MEGALRAEMAIPFQVEDFTYFIFDFTIDFDWWQGLLLLVLERVWGGRF